MVKPNKGQVKKILLILFIILLSSYVLWDMSLRVVNYFRMQGYEIAVMEMVRQAENEECAPFSIFTGEKNISLINISCLQEGEDVQGEVFEEESVMMGEE